MDEVEKHPLHYASGGWGFHGKPELSWRQVKRLGAGGNYVCCFVIVVIFMGLGGAKR